MSSPDTSGYTRIVPYNDHDDAVLTPSATAAVGFPATDTQNDIRSRVWRTTSTSSQSVTGVLSATRTANHFSMWRMRAQGASVRLQLYSDAGASAQVYDSTALAVNCFSDSDPYTWSTGTNNPFLEYAPFVHWFANTNYRSYKVTWSGTPTNWSYFQVSRIVLGKYFEFTHQPKFGMSLGLDDLTDRNRSMGGSLRTNIGESWRTLQLDWGWLEDTERATILKIKRQLGKGRSLVVSIYPGNGTDLERDHMMLCKFVSLDPIIRDINVYTTRMQFEET